MARVVTLCSEAGRPAGTFPSTDRRGSATITFRPFESTTIRAFGETTLVRATPPQNRPPLDGFSYWWSVGKPVYNANTGAFSFLEGTPPTTPGINGNPAQFLSAGRHRGGVPTAVIEDPNTGVYGLSIPGNPQAIVFAPTRVRRNAANTQWINGSVYSTNLANVYLQAINGGASNPANGFWRAPQMTDPTVFDFFNHQLDGPSRTRDGRWKNLNVTVEQRLGRNAGIELGFDRQNLDEIFRNVAFFNAYAINLDVTTTLVDGPPNPNFGRPFMAGSSRGVSRNRQRDAFRATGYYDFEFKRVFGEGSLWSRILGRHTLTSNYTSQDEDIRFHRGNDMLDLDWYNIVQAGNAGTTTVATAHSGGPRELNVVTYLGPNLSGTTSPQNQGIQGLEARANTLQTNLSSISLRYYPVPPANTTMPNQWTTGDFGVIHTDEWSMASASQLSTHTYNKFKAVSLVLQDRWFENTLISTLGWRRDWVRTYNAGNARYDATGQAILDESVWPLLPQLDQRRDAFNYGLVLHVPEFFRRRLPKSVEISFLYNQSDNFTPQAARHNVYGQQINPPTGETKEYGLLLSLFDRKIDLRATHYITNSALASNVSFATTMSQIQNVTFSALRNLDQGAYDFDPESPSFVPDNVKQAFRNFFRDPVATAFFSPEVSGFHVDANGNLQGVNGPAPGLTETSDTAGKGLEFEITANLTRDWRLTANVARQESILSNSAVSLWAMLQSWRPLIIDGLAGDMPTTPGGATTWSEQFLTNEATVQRFRALDGTKTPEVRKWRYNLVTNYSCNDGVFKGWAIGGALRWQDKSAIGYPVALISGAPQFDVTQPYFGPTETNVDAWISHSRRIWNDKVKWRAQLNVRNIGERNRLIPVSAQPDGTIDAYRIGANATWSLSNTFEF